MSATLWIDTEADETVELGGTIPFYGAFAKMQKIAGGMDDYPDLFGVMTQVELQEDADPDWLADVRDQATTFLDKHKGDLDEYTIWMLEQLSTAGA